MKRNVLLRVAILVLATLSLSAQNTTTRFFIAYDYENLTIDSTVGGVGFTVSKINASDGPANQVTFTIDCSAGTTCPIRMTADGTAPTTSVGMRADYQQSVTIYSRTNITAFRAIQEGGTSAIINVQFYR